MTISTRKNLAANEIKEKDTYIGAISLVSHTRNASGASTIISAL